MSTERDELAGVVSAAVGGWNQNTRAITDVADAILAAGYRKPPTIDNDKLIIKDGLLLLDVGDCTCTPYGSSHEYHCGLEYLNDLTKPLERAGYTRNRTVSTVEELGALPVGSVVLDRDGDMSRRFSGGWRTVVTEPHIDPWLTVPLEDVELPATVLHSPVVAG